MLPLCNRHHDEYVLQYLAYKESSRRAEELYELLPLLVASLDAYRALRATQLCIDALDKEICERDAHRKRFFTQGEWTLAHWHSRLAPQAAYIDFCLW